MSFAKTPTKTSSQLLKSKQGFSLIELMVVVGIMGMLVSIAWPSYRKYQARSRQVEAKTELTHLFLAMQAFHAEWKVHIGAFGPIGYAPEGEFRYNVGFETMFKDKFCGGQGGTSMTEGNTLAADAELECGPSKERKYRGNTTAGCDLKTVAAQSAHPELKFTGSDDLGADMVLKGSGLGKIETDVKDHSFIAGAVGDPLGLGAATADNRDAWSIDQDKVFKQNAGSKVGL